jgi:hypothetical protein
MNFEKFLGIVEMDETYFLYPEKGKCKVEGIKSNISITTNLTL